MIQIAPGSAFIKISTKEKQTALCVKLPVCFYVVIVPSAYKKCQYPDIFHINFTSFLRRGNVFADMFPYSRKYRDSKHTDTDEIKYLHIPSLCERYYNTIYTLPIRSRRMALITHSMATPVSAKIAIHIFAIPNAPRISVRILMQIAP